MCAEDDTVEFDQGIIDEFLKNLSKSKPGKTIPWYENNEEGKKVRELFEFFKSQAAG